MEVRAKGMDEAFITKLEDELFYVKDESGKERPQKYCDIRPDGVIDFLDDDTTKTNENKKVAYKAYKESHNLEEIWDSFQAYYHALKNRTYMDVETQIERQYFNIVEDYANGKYIIARSLSEDFHYASNGNTDSFDPDYANNRNKCMEEEQLTKKVRDNPYFGEFITKNDQATYIGYHEIPGKVIDWRSRDITDHYYNPVKYEDIKVTRKFDIVKGKLKTFSDDYNLEQTDSGYSDEFLVRLIEAQRDNPDMRSIAGTIQAQQYSVIGEPIDTNLIVLGCAGSGKTSIMLHRLSYMVFNEFIKPQDVTVISPNKLLNMENTELAKELDLGDCHRTDINDFYLDTINDYINRNSFNTYERDKFVKELRVNGFDANYTVDDNMLESIYSDGFRASFEDTLISVIKNPDIECYGFNFCQYEEELISTEERKLFGDRINHENDKSILGYYSKMAEDYQMACRSISRGNVEAKLTGKGNASESTKTKYEKSKLKINESEGIIRGIELRYANESKSVEAELEYAETELINILMEIKEFKTEAVTYKPEVVNILIKKKVILEEKLSDLNSKRNKIAAARAKELKASVPDLKEYNRIRKQYNALMLFRGCNDLSGAVTKTETGHYSVNEKLFKQLYDFYDKYEDQLGESIDDGHESTCEFVKSLNKLSIKVKNYEKFINESDCRYFLTDIIMGIIDYYKSKNQLEPKQYEFEVYLILIGLNKIYGKIDNDKGFIILDEFQECSANEIDLIKNSYHYVGFNLYGDPMQCLMSKGTYENDSDYYGDLGYITYKFDKNYRNAMEITQYINHNYGLNIEGIGLHGTAIEIRERKFVGISQRNDGKRSVLLVKSKNEYDSLIKGKDKEKYNYINESNLLMDKKKINAIPVRLAKGMEFENVYVYDRNMNHKEMYVACTRALENLCVIKSR